MGCHQKFWSACTSTTLKTLDVIRLNCLYQCGITLDTFPHHYFVNQAHSSKFLLQNSRLPFEWRNLPTYALVAIVQCIAVTYLFHIIAGCLVLGIGNYVFGIVAVANFKKCLKLLDKVFKSKTNLKHSMKNLTLIVRYHSALKQLRISVQFAHHFLIFYLFQIKS